MGPSRLQRACRVLVPCLGLALLAGCGKGGGKESGELTFQRLADTTGLGQGAPLLEDFDAYRMDSGALRVQGRSRLPDSTRLRVAIKRAGSAAPLAMVQVTLLGGSFDSPPIIGERGPLPKDRYAIEVSAQFLPGWQPESVLRATDRGRSLRGPGITRTRVGDAMLFLVEEMTR